jgi:hypothetical protein
MPDPTGVFAPSFRSVLTETLPTGHPGLVSRRVSLAVDEVHVGPSADRVSAVGEVLLGPLRDTDTFTSALGKARDEISVRLTIVGMTRGRRHVTQAKRGTTVRLTLMGDGTETVRPGDLLLGEAESESRPSRGLRLREPEAYADRTRKWLRGRLGLDGVHA